MFLSAFYFNRGPYHGDSAGLTCYDNNGLMSAYKMFEDDPIFFEKSMMLRWRCGEKQGEPEGCPNVFQKSHPYKSRSFVAESVDAYNPKPTVVSFYVWVYEYTF